MANKSLLPVDIIHNDVVVGNYIADQYSQASFNDVTAYYASRDIVAKLKRLKALPSMFSFTYLDSIYILPEHRQKGIAAATIASLISTAKGTHLLLFTIADSAQSIRDKPEHRMNQDARIVAYQKMGYTIIRDKRDVYGYKITLDN